MLSAGGAVGDQQTQLDALNAELAGCRAPTPSRRTTTRAGGREGERDHRAVHRTLRPGRLGSRPPRALAGPARRRLALEPREPEPAGAPRPIRRPRAPGVILTGATYSQNGVARLLARLAVLPTLANVQPAVEHGRAGRQAADRPVHDHRRTSTPGGCAREAATDPTDARRRSSSSSLLAFGAFGWFVLVSPEALPPRRL